MKVFLKREPKEQRKFLKKSKIKTFLSNSLVTDLRSTVIINLYEVDKKKKKDYHLASYSLPISELESGDIKREVLEICPGFFPFSFFFSKNLLSDLFF